MTTHKGILRSVVLLMIWATSIMPSSVYAQITTFSQIIIERQAPSGIVNVQNSFENKDLSKFSNKVSKTRKNPIKRPNKGISAQNSTELIVLTLESNENIQEIASELEKEADILYAEPVYPVELHSDPNLGNQTYLSDYGLDNVLSWPSVENVIVAVLDTGIDYTHDEMENMLFINENDPVNGIDDDENGYTDDYYGYHFYGYTNGNPLEDPYDNYSHGTHIAGIIGAEANNSIGITGLNNNIQILNLGFLNQSGWGNQLDAAAAIYYAVEQGAKIINCSWGYTASNTVLEEAVNYAIDSGVIIVASAGNNSSSTTLYPAGFPGVISVASNGSNLRHSWFSNNGEHIDITAPGEAIYGLENNNAYGNKSGTSQSAAMVSGVLSRVLNILPNLDTTDILELLSATSYDLEVEGKDDYTGYGLIDPSELYTVVTALYAADITGSLTESTITTLEVSNAPTLTSFMNYPNPIKTSAGTTFSFNASHSGTIQIDIFDLTGRRQHRISNSVLSGVSTISWDGSDNGDALPNGTYLAVATLSTSVGTVVEKQKLTIIK